MRTLWMSAAVTILSLSSLAAAQKTETRAAVAAGKTITMDELNSAAAASIAKLDANRPATEAAYARARLETLHAVLGGLIEDQLLAAEAVKWNDTTKRVLEVEVESNIVPPSDQEAIEFYELNKAQIPIPRDQALPQVKQYLVNRQRGMLEDNLFRRLKTTHGVKVYLDPLRTEIATAGFPTRGQATAPITIVEFADFQCPFCGRMFPVLNRIEKGYAEKVRVVYRQFPLTQIHQFAQKASEASLCANEQKKFWEFHDSLFGNQNELTVESLKKRAVELKLDAAAFNTCLDSNKQADAVKKDIDDGGRAGVSGTPTLFINGRRFSGSTDEKELRELIDDELQRVSAK